MKKADYYIAKYAITYREDDGFYVRRYNQFGDIDYEFNAYFETMEEAEAYIKTVVKQ